MNANSDPSIIWVFISANAKHPSGVFGTSQSADKEILRHKLSGTLTGYPLNRLVFDWAVDLGFFHPKTDRQLSAEFVGGFTSAMQQHFHYENGEKLV